MTVINGEGRTPLQMTDNQEVKKLIQGNILFLESKSLNADQVMQVFKFYFHCSYLDRTKHPGDKTFNFTQSFLHFINLNHIG